MDNDKQKTALVTGAAGFIGYHISKRLLDEGWRVLGLDCMSDYYDVSLKERREGMLLQNAFYRSVHGKVEVPNVLMDLFEEERPDVVIHLAAQAGVRYSIENPRAYLESNINGTFELLEAARAFPPEHMLLASTSSAYGANEEMPYKETTKADSQMSFYAATKKSTENMAHSYAHLFDLPITMFRFFTVYGPWGRPDMALFKFTKAILNGDAIEVYNHGNVTRDFTYIDDLVKGMRLLIDASPADNNLLLENANVIDCKSDVAPFRVVNIGNSKPEKLTDFIKAIEEAMRLKNNIVLFFSGTAFSAVLAFVQNLIIVRSLTLEEFAKFATIMSVCFMGSAFITFRTSEALLTTFRTKPEGRAIGDTSQVFTVSIYAELLPRILLVSLLVLGAPYLVSFTVLNEADVSIFKIATIVVLLNTTSEIWHALARINVKINELAFCDAFFSFLSIVLICCAVYFNIISVQNIILILVCVGLLKFLFQFWRIITLAHSFDLALQFRLRFLKDNEFFNVFKKTMLNGYLMSTVQSPLKYGDILIANLFMQSSEIAIYRIAKSVFNVCQTIPNIIVKLLFYDFVKNIQEHELANIRATLIKLML